MRDLRLVDAAVSRYRRHVEPTAEERERLADTLWARALLLECWSVGAGRHTPAQAVGRLRWAQRQAGPIAERALAALAA